MFYHKKKTKRTQTSYRFEFKQEFSFHDIANITMTKKKDKKKKKIVDTTTYVRIKLDFVQSISIFIP